MLRRMQLPARPMGAPSSENNVNRFEISNKAQHDQSIDYTKLPSVLLARAQTQVTTRKQA
jgi:hypothetical protein